MAKKDAAQPSTEVAVATPNANALAVSADYGDYAGSGFENQSSADYAIPFLGILQGLSPQLQDPANGHMRQGMILNTVTGELFPSNEGVAFVPAYTEHKMMEWKPRAAGGGLVAAHEVNAPVVVQLKDQLQKAGQSTFGVLKTPDGNDLIETFYVYGIAIDAEGVPSQAVISFSGTKISKYRAWQTKAKTIQLQLPDGRRIVAPLFSHRYRLTTTLEKNNKGQYFNWSIAFDGENAAACRLAPSDELFQAAVAVKEMVSSGKARAATESLSPEGEGESGAPAGRPDGKPVF